jgi:hypothetical protein
MYRVPPLSRGYLSLRRFKPDVSDNSIYMEFFIENVGDLSMPQECAEEMKIVFL